MPINETLKFDVSWGGSNRASATMTIMDTSRPDYEMSLVASTGSTTPITEIDIPTYILTSNKASVSEGEAFEITLTTTKLDPGTVIPYTITGISLADVTLDSLKGSFTINNTGLATLTVTTNADFITETNETFTLTLDNLNVSKDVIINDTSRAPVYELGWYSDNAGTNAIASTNEGDALFLVIKTQNVNNGTVVNVNLSGAGVTPGDFVRNALTFSITINNSIGFADLTTVADVLTEGNEVITATGNVGGSNVGSATITLIDTSKAPEYIATPNGTYHHKAGPAEFVIAPNTTKRLKIYPAGPSPSNAEWDGASGGLTGLYIANGQPFEWSTFTGVLGASAAFGHYTYNDYDRNGGGPSTNFNGYWNWGGLTGNAEVGKTGTVDGIKVTIETIFEDRSLRTYMSGDGNQGYANIITVTVENTNSTAKTLFTMYGEEATEGGWGMSGTGDGTHGVQGGTLAHGIPDSNYIDHAFKPTWTSGNTFVADGYMIVSD